MRPVRFSLLALLLAARLAAPAAAAPGPVVAAPAGEVRGEAADGVRSFKGIPYAAPPVGAARWTPPRPAPKWDGVRDAGEFGPACMQPKSRPGSI